MKKHRPFLTSILYIIFESLSRGGSTLIFIMAASMLDKDSYINLLALYSLEGFFTIISPLFYIEILYKLKDRYTKKVVGSNLQVLTVIYWVLLIILIAVFNRYLSRYYNTLFIVLACITINAASKIIFRNKSVNNQIDENHKQAIIDRSLPFFISFSIGLIGFLSLPDKLLGFFAGRTLGYIATFIVYSIKRGSIPKFRFNIEIRFVKDYLSRSLFLISTGIFSWFAGYGMLNLLKTFYSTEVSYNIGLFLNIWVGMELLANGINAVYTPLFRKAFHLSLNKAKNIYKKVSAVYLLVLGASILLYLTLKLPALNNILTKLSLIKYYDIVPYVILAFLAQIFQYISIPIYYVNDWFKKLSAIVLVSSLVGVGLIFLHYKISFISQVNLLYIIVAGYYIKALSIFMFSFSEFSPKTHANI